MNTQYGTKWFTFYTKVRPWLGLLSALAVTIDFIQYVDVYLATWWLMIYFILTLALAALAFATFVKSYGDYREFVPFVEIVVCIEAISFPLLMAIQNYLNSGLDDSTIAGSLLGGYLVAYFIWYRQNRLYFRRRVLPSQKELTFDLSDDTQITTIYTRTPVAHKKSKKRYCKFCGSAINPSTKQCTGCGKQYFKIRFKNGLLVIVILAIISVASVSVCVYQHVHYQQTVSILTEKVAELESKVTAKDLMISEWKERTNRRDEKITQLNIDILGLQNEISFFDRCVVFVLNNNSNLYHNYKCVTFQQARPNKSFWAYNTEAAKSRGYQACPDCCG